MAGSAGSTYVDVMPNMQRYYREARREIRANPVVGRVDVELDRAALARAERQLVQSTDRAVSARNRQLTATENLQRAQRDLNRTTALGNASADQLADATQRVARAHRAATEAATARNRAEDNLARDRTAVTNLRTNLDTSQARADQQGLERSFAQRAITQYVRLEAITAPYRMALAIATRAVVQTVRLALDVSKAMTGLFLISGVIAAIGGAVGLVGGLVGGLVAMFAAVGLAAAAAGAVVMLGMDGIKAAFGQLQWQFDEMKRQISGVFQEALQPAVEGVGEIMTALLEPMKEVARSISGVINGIVEITSSAGNLETLKTIFEGVGKFVEAMGPGLQSLVQGLIDFGATAAPALEGIGRALGTVFAVIGQAFAAIDPAFFTSLIQMMQGFAPLIAGLLDMLFTMATIVMPELLPLFSALGDLFRQIGPSLGALGATLAQALTPLMPVLANLISALATGLAPILPILSNILGIIGTALAGIMPTLSLAIQTIGIALVGALEAIAPALGPFVEALASIIVALAPILPLFGELIAMLVEALAPAIISLVSGLAPLIEQLVAQLGPILAQLGPVLAQVAMALGQALLEAITMLLPIMPQMYEAFMQIVVAIAPLIPDLLRLAVLIIEQLVPFIPLLADTLTMVANAITLLMPWWKVLIQILEIAVMIIGVSLMPVMLLLEGIMWAINWALTALRDPFQWLMDKIGELVGWAKKKAEELKTWFEELPGKVKEWVKDAGTWLKDAGKKIIEGLIDGIKGKFTDVKNTLKELGDKLIPDWKGPASYDAVMLVGAGQLIIEGLINGLESRYDAVKSTLGALGSMVASTTIAPPVLAEIAPAAAPVAAPLDPTAEAPDPNATADVLTGALTSVQGATAAMGTAFGGTMTTAAGQFATLATTMSGQKLGVIDPTLAGVNAGLIGTQGQFVNSANVINPTFADMANRIMAAKTGTVDPALAGMRGGVQHTADTYGYASTLLAQKWDSVREGTAAPVRWSIGNVFNDGVVGSWNSVSELLGTAKMNQYPIRFATGGSVPEAGYERGRDSVPALLMPGEFVLRKAVVDKLGIRNLDMVNRGADPQGAIPDMRWSDVASRFAGGGLAEGNPAWLQLKRGYDWARSRNGRPYVLGGSANGGGGTDCSGYMSGIADIIGGGDGARQWATMSFNGGGNSQMPSGPQGFVAGLAAGFSVGVTNGGPAGGHTAGTIGGVPGMPAVNVESGGSHGNVAFGGPAVGADHQQFPTQYHLGLTNDRFVTGGGGGASIGALVASMTGPIWDGVAAKVAGTSFGGMTAPIPKGYYDSMRGAVDKKIDEIAATVLSADPGGTDVERWRPMSKRAMTWVGRGLQPEVPAQVNAMLSQIKSESGGIPNRAQEIVDVNGTGASAGLGLLQIIPTTWAANRDPSLPDDRTDPFANMVGALRYYTGRYGSDLTTMWGQGHGYHDGGMLLGQGLFNKTAIDPERVLSPTQTRTFESVMPILEAVNRNIATVAPAMSSSDVAFLEDAGISASEFVGQKVETQYIVDPAEQQRIVRRATKRAVAGSGVQI